MARQGLQDVVGDALPSVTSRFGRSMLTLAGTALGVAGLVTTTGFAASASDQVAGTFDSFQATTVVLRDQAVDPASVPEDIDSRLRELNGVASGGWSCALDPARSPVKSTTGTLDPLVGAYAVTPGFLAAAQPTWLWGEPFSEVHAKDDLPVAVVGASVSRSLNLATGPSGPMIKVGERSFHVTGVYADVKRYERVLDAVLLPREPTPEVVSTCAEPPDVLLATDLGAASLVARQAPMAIDAVDTERFAAILAPDVGALQQRVQSDVSTLYLFLTVLSCLVGSLAIANTMSVSVLERTAEMGLRRALGSTPRDLRWLVLIESATLGLIGGVLGACLGTVAVVAVTVAKGWAPHLDLFITGVGPLIGLVTGVVGGLVPAIRASRIEPAAALRQ